ncbi:MAG: hypothetical protein AABP62_15375 [Planctomycetota bacterium]
MFIDFPCDCGHRFRTQRDNAGMRVVCPNCLKEMQVPAASEPKPPAPVVPASAPPPVPAVKQAAVRQAVPTKGPAPQASLPSKPASSKSAVKPAKPKPSEIDEESLLDDLGPMEATDDSLEELPEFTPTRRKKKKSSEKQDDDTQKTKKKSKGGGSGGKVAGIVGGIVAGLALLGVVGFFAIPPMITAIKEAGKITAPTEFEQFRDTDLNFSCLHPKGWVPIARGGTGNVPPSVRLEQGKVKIAFRASVSGAAIQDTTQAMTNQAGELPDELKPVARVHDFQKAKFSDEMTNYREVGPVEKINTGVGEGRLSTFVASGSFGSQIFGYRATLLTTQFQWNVVCQCSSQREFTAYKAMFRKIIESAGQ